MSRIVIILLLFLFPWAIQAQTTISIVDAQTQEPVPYVSLKGNNQQTYVGDQDGS